MKSLALLLVIILVIVAINDFIGWIRLQRAARNLKGETHE